MDDETRAAIGDLKNDLKSDLSKGFDRLDMQIGQLVTKGEFAATVQRIDIQHGTLRSEYQQHVSEAPAHRLAASARADAVKAEVKTDLEGFRTTTRWAIGITIPATGLLVTIIQLVANSIQ